MLDAIDELPLLAGLFQLVGLIYTIRFGVKKVSTAEKRAQVVADLQQLWAEISGSAEGLCRERLGQER